MDKGASTTLPGVTASGNNSSLSCNHRISSNFDAANDRFTISVEVIELRLGDSSILEHLVKMVTPKDTRRSDGAAAWSCVEKMPHQVQVAPALRALTLMSLTITMAK